MTQPLIEVCVEGVDGLVAAQNAGADRVELCASLLEGGLTPSLGIVKQALKVATIPFHVIVRPRGGDFLYSSLEFESMRSDVMALRDMGVAGVVVGCLTADGHIDETRTSALVAAARPMSVTCHRAFDMTRNIAKAVEALARCGIDRVLTSGQRATATEGMSNIRRTVELARGRFKVMACGGLDMTNIAEVRTWSGADELHFAALTNVRSPMAHVNDEVAMGNDEDASREYDLTITDEGMVRAMIYAVRGEP
jgi:copper homeostasis protein